MPGRSRRRHHDDGFPLARKVCSEHHPVVAALLRGLVFQRAVSPLPLPVRWLACCWASFKPGIVSALEQSGSFLEFVTDIVVHPAPGVTAVLTPHVNPLFYTYGLALFLALMLAVRAKWWKILVGAAVLLPFQSWGIAFDFLLQVGVMLGPDVSAQAGLSGKSKEIIVLGYQIGHLIFPSLIPVVLWAVFNRQFINNLLRLPVRTTLTHSL